MSPQPLQPCDCCQATHVLTYTVFVYPFLHKAKWEDILVTLGALDDVTTSSNSKNIRSGKSKACGRRYVLCCGLLIIYK